MQKQTTVGWSAAILITVVGGLILCFGNISIIIAWCACIAVFWQLWRWVFETVKYMFTGHKVRPTVSTTMSVDDMARYIAREIGGTHDSWAQINSKFSTLVNAADVSKPLPNFFFEVIKKKIVYEMKLFMQAGNSLSDFQIAMVYRELSDVEQLVFHRFCLTNTLK